MKPKPKVAKKKKVNKRKRPKKPAAPKTESLGKYSQMAIGAHEQWQGIVQQMAKPQRIGMMRGLAVERITEGPQVRFIFNWRGVPDGIGADALIDLCVVTLEALEWPEVPAIVVRPAELDRDYQVILTW